MLRRILAHLLTSLALFVLTITFLVWVMDLTILNPSRLVAEMRRSDVPKALSNAIPELVTTDNKELDSAKLPQIKSDLQKALSPEYLDLKISNVANSFGDFIRSKSDNVTIDLTDFPAHLKAVGVESNNIDSGDSFQHPTVITKNNNLAYLPKAYKFISTLKYLGPALFLFILLLEWLASEKGFKLKRLGRIFLHAGFWSVSLWLLILLVPKFVSPTIDSKVGNKVVLQELVTAVIKTGQGLLAFPFLGFGIISFAVAILVYSVRYVLPKTNLDAPKRVKKV